ncbi:MAG: hypothetical protein IJ736_14995, partial [Firmicutes bacterium]|nr:hypothetical protein [Bacillota bacterium]
MEFLKKMMLFSLPALLCVMLAACTEETSEKSKGDKTRKEMSSEITTVETTTEATTEIQKISLGGLSDDDNSWYCMKNDKHDTPEMPD